MWQVEKWLRKMATLKSQKKRSKMSHAPAYEISSGMPFPTPKSARAARLLPRCDPASLPPLRNFFWLADMKPSYLLWHFCFSGCVKASPNLAAIRRHAQVTASTFFSVCRQGRGRAENRDHLAHLCTPGFVWCSICWEWTRHSKTWQVLWEGQRRDSNCWTQRRGHASSVLQTGRIFIY